MKKIYLDVCVLSTTHLINLAALGAFVDDLRGKKYVKWEHVRAK